MMSRWRLALISTLCACAAAAGWSGWRAWQDYRVESTLQAAKAAIGVGARARAWQLLNRAAAIRPAHGEVQFLLGAAEQARGNPQGAEAAWDRIPADSNFAPIAAMFRARRLLQAERFAAAEPLLLRAKAGTGAVANEARQTLVRLFKIEGRYGEARDLVLESWATYPDKAGLLRELETLGSTNPMSVQAVHDELVRVADRAPDDDRIWLGWANYSIRTGQLDEAKRRLDACLQKKPDDPAVWKGWLDWALANQNPDEVIRALRHLPDDRLPPSEVLTLQAWLAAMAGNDKLEAKAQEQLAAIEPGNVKAIERLADIALRAGQADRANQLREHRAELSRLRYAYADALFQGGNQANPAQAARMAERIGRQFEASAFWAQILKANPDDAEAKEAIRRMKAAEKPAPTRPTIRDLLAEVAATPQPPAGAGFAGAIPAFAEAAEAVGLRFAYDDGVSTDHQMPETVGGGIGLIDYDGDGDLDVYLTQGEPFPNDPDHPRGTGDRLFRNRGDGTFEDATAAAGLAEVARGYSHGVAVGDYDNDGHPDLFVTRWRRYALYRNRGDGTFEDRTAAAGLDGERDWPTSSVLADLDGDGDADLYVCHYLIWDSAHPELCRDPRLNRNAYCAPQHFKALPDHLFRNDDGRFVDVTAEAGIVDGDGRGLGVVAADFDGDGKLDLFVANDQSANFVWRNLGGMKFEEAAASFGMATNADGNYQASMGVTTADFDGDGKLDLAKTNFFNESMTLYLNRGGGVFVDSTAAIGLAAPTRFLLGFGVEAFDANNDGWPDLASANGHIDDFRPEIPWKMPAQLLLNAGGRRFVDVSRRAGPAWAVPRVARGLAAGDLDNDGQVDLLIIAHGDPLAYYHQQVPTGHWASFRLDGAPKSGRDAIGAQVRVTADGRTRTQWRVGGGSYASASDPRLHFGLDQNTVIEQCEVRWPSGHVDRFRSIPADATYLIREGQPDVTSISPAIPTQPNRPIGPRKENSTSGNSP